MTDTQTNALTQEELDAVPAGYRVVDKDGHELTRCEDGYIYTGLLESMGDGRPDGFMVVQLKADKWPAPFTPAPLTTEELEALPAGSVIADDDGDRIHRLPGGWLYEHLVEEGGMGGAASGTPISCPPYTLVSVGEGVAGDGYDAAHEEELAAIASGYGG